MLAFLSFISLSILIPIGKLLPLTFTTIIFLGIGGFGLPPFECKALEMISPNVPESLAVNGLHFLTNILGLPLGLISTLKGIKINFNFLKFLQSLGFTVYGHCLLAYFLF